MKWVFFEVLGGMRAVENYNISKERRWRCQRQARRTESAKEQRKSKSREGFEDGDGDRMKRRSGREREREAKGRKEGRMVQSQHLISPLLDRKN